jgi:hypothetical protein
MMPPATKLFWVWLNDNADHAGIVSPDFEVASLQIGQPVNEQNITELGDRLKMVSSGKYWIQGFIEFQHGDITPNKARKNMSYLHAMIWKLLDSHGLKYVPSSNNVQATNQPSRNLPANLPTTSEEPPIISNGISNKGDARGKRGRSPAQDAGWQKKKMADAVKIEWLARFNDAFPSEHGYQITGPDSGRLRDFLKECTLTADQIIKVAVDAWAFKTGAPFSHARNLRSLAYLCNHFNEIKSEIYGNKNSKTGNPNATAHTLNAGRTGQYRDVGKVV